MGPAEPSEHPDLTRLLADLAAKGYRDHQLGVIRSEWEAACRLGAHPDLAVAMQQLADRAPAGD